MFVRGTLLLALPWLVNLAILLHATKLAGRNTDGPFRLAIGLWVLVFVAVVVPSVVWTDGERASLRVLEHLLEETMVRVGTTLLHVLRYILPFAAYPLIVFWIKLIANYRADSEETGDGATDRRDRREQRTQARLITFAIKVMVVVFVFFDLINRLGIETDEVLQIGTVFSLGLSWSMRDWLASLWAGIMIGFTSALTVGRRILVGTAAGADGPVPRRAWLRVRKTGLIFTVCTREVAAGSADGSDSSREVQEIHVPNATLMSAGFVLAR